MTVSYMRIGDRIRALRELKNLSIADVAAKTNFTQKSLLLAESGRATLSLEFLLAMCNVLHTTPNDILSGEYEEPEKPMSRVPSLSVARAEDGAAPIRVAQSHTKINDTQETLDQIERMVIEQKRASAPSPSPRAGATNHYK